jgi:quercetin dioxygenase-like cupin family protein
MTIPKNPRKLFIYKGSKVSEFVLDKGEGLPRHEHTVNHLTMCILGSSLIRKENIEVVLTPESEAVDLKANEWHEIEALEDNTIIVNIE